jgi:AAA+ ATPase superfamily predicted ATPase
VYYVGDSREAGLHRTAVAEAISLVIPGFDDVVYPDWNGLLKRWWNDAPNGATLAIDEFPYLVESSPALPSILQKFIDAFADKPVHLVLCGSSQRMMQGLVLDESEPLYGRAREILEIQPLGAAWLSAAFHSKEWNDLFSAYAVWGGIPRYWELAADYDSLWDAVQSLVLDPLGVLHQEPVRLLSDDMRDTVQASSILAVVGQGCHRLSEIAGRLSKPATSLTRPVQRLLQLGLLKRDVPFGQNPRSSKSTLYTVGDPFLAFWFRFVEPNRSRLGAGALGAVKRNIQQAFPQHEALCWEQLVRQAIPRTTLDGVEWGPAARWWGTGNDRTPMEFDVLAESITGNSLLIGEVKRHVTSRDLRRLKENLLQKTDRLPLARPYDDVRPFVFALDCPEGTSPDTPVITASDLMPGLT